MESSEAASFLFTKIFGSDNVHPPRFPLMANAPLKFKEPFYFCEKTTEEQLQCNCVQMQIKEKMSFP